MTKVKATITYRTKVRTMADGRPYLDYKKAISRHDCNLKPHQHDYYNFDGFPSMLQKAAQAAQKGRTWCYLDELPEAVTVDTSSFLAQVTVSIEV